jgi:DNA-binding MarR family transcriptional regulator
MEPHFSFDHIVELLTRHFAELESAAIQESELSELSMKQIVYLETISTLDPPTFSNLAKRMRVSKPSVTAIVSKLIQKGYVERAQSLSDKRTFFILLSEKGRSLQRVHADLHRKIAGHFTHALDENEQAHLAYLLEKILKSGLK